MYISLQMKCFVLRGGFIMCRQPMISPCMHGIKRAFYGRVRGVEGGGGGRGEYPNLSQRKTYTCMLIRKSYMVDSVPSLATFDRGSG